MFNSEYKNVALAALQSAGYQHKAVFENVIQKAQVLHSKRMEARNVLVEFRDYVRAIRNKPYDIEKILGVIEIRLQKFDSAIDDIKKQSEDDDTITKEMMGGGALAGAGVAAFGPSAAMAVATTFGTASTGAAIGTLSGVAATNAALAWLGGGALVAGGGGMAAGEALLAMAGPVGWAIGGIGIIGGGLMASSKNKKIAKEAEEKTREIQSKTEKNKKEIIKIDQLHAKITDELQSGICDILDNFVSRHMYDHHEFSTDDKHNFMIMNNIAESLSKYMGEKID
ncbi:MAG: hypothetical protein LKI76_04250 [Megasphaera sp.]|jgi:hypothetical protein|nr:hypothetical protein [Megasphaera sp.]